VSVKTEQQRVADGRVVGPISEPAAFWLAVLFSTGGSEIRPCHAAYKYSYAL